MAGRANGGKMGYWAAEEADNKGAPLPETQKHRVRTGGTTKCIAPLMDPWIRGREDGRRWGAR